MNLFKRITLFVLMNIGLMASIAVLAFVVERFFGIKVTASLADGYTSLAIYSIIFGFASAFISLALSRVMAKWMYTIKLLHEERLIDYSPKEQLVFATVARIAKQEGIAMPEVGIYESDEPNAFATGPTRNRALVTASTGLLEMMNQEEIEWVIGHEMAHVLNGDMVTMTLLQGVLNAIVIFVSRILATMISSAFSKDGEENAWIYPVASIGLQIGLGFVAMIVLMAFSRHREYRADEGSAKLLGKGKMIAALKRLDTIKDRLAGHVSEEDSKLATFQITNYSLSTLFSSHPPLQDRVKSLEARYDIN